MAVSKVAQKSSLVMEIENGVDKSGNTIYKKKSYSNVKPTAAPQDVMDVALSIKEILSVGIRNISINETSTLLKDGE